MLRQAYFITGIGTGVGKTLVTAALAHQLREAGKPCRALKPIISGFDPDSEDTDSALLMKATGEQDIDAISPWRYAAPLSPHLAAAREGKAVHFDDITGWCHAQMFGHGVTLIEGVGGLMVPLDEEKQVIDWIAALETPTILVSASYLGAINHTLLSVAALKQAGIPLHAIIISQSGCDDAGLEETKSSVRLYIDTATPILTIPRLPDSDNTWKHVPNLLSLIDGF